MIHLFLGGARSGKSRLAQAHAIATGQPVSYIATATVEDDEMAKRIAHHRDTRPTDWFVIEEPLALEQAIQAAAQHTPVILVDCLTLWLSNLLQAGKRLPEATEPLLALLQSPPAELILVSNETGLGVVPLGALTREFVDGSGFLHQRIAQLANKVTFCIAGLPMPLKSQDTP